MVLSHVVDNRKCVSDLAATLKDLFLGPCFRHIFEIHENRQTSAYISSKKNDKTYQFFRLFGKYKSQSIIQDFKAHCAMHTVRMAKG